MINFYRDMWWRRSETLAPLTRLTSKDLPYKWTEVEQKAFKDIKAIISKDVLLAYPNFLIPFDVHTNASDTQLGAVISQKGQLIAFFSQKLTSAQRNYSTIEKELLSIVETFKEFRTILLGQSIRVLTDHKNLTCSNLTSERVYRWRLVLEEYGPEVVYIKGIHNNAADALSRLDILEAVPEASLRPVDLAERYDIDDIPADAYPLTYSLIDREQCRDLKLKKGLLQGRYSTQSFHGGGKSRHLICHNGLIVVPFSLQQRVVEWYHTYLLHPGADRTEATIRQHLWFPDMRTKIRTQLRHCHTCQIYKKQKKKYGYLPAKKAEATPWERVCVDLIGPYTINRPKGQEPLHLRALTMVDPATGWFEMAEYDDKQAISIADLFERTWLSRYPWPTEIMYDRGSEFIGHEFTRMVRDDYGLKVRKATTKNPQSNTILKRLHQVLGNMIRTHELEDAYVDEANPWGGIIAATCFGIRSTYHTTLAATPGQLVFGRDMIFNIKHEANWHDIRARKQARINENNARENARRIPHTYVTGDKVLLERTGARKLERPYDGPYTISHVFSNGTVTISMPRGSGALFESVNIRRLTPYHD